MVHGLERHARGDACHQTGREKDTIHGEYDRERSRDGEHLPSILAGNLDGVSGVCPLSAASSHCGRVAPPLDLSDALAFPAAAGAALGLGKFQPRQKSTESQTTLLHTFPTAKGCALQNGAWERRPNRRLNALLKLLPRLQLLIAGVDALWLTLLLCR
jgi:hypothetical protein